MKILKSHLYHIYHKILTRSSLKAESSRIKMYVLCMCMGVCTHVYILQKVSRYQITI